MLDYASRFLQLEREVDRFRSDLEGSRVELKGARSALEESKGELEVVKGELSFGLVSSCYLVPLLTRVPCSTAERCRAIDLSTDLRRRLEEAQGAERESRRQMEELQRRLDAMMLEKESMLGRVHGVVDKLSGA